MLHLVKCRHTKPLWNKCLQFCRDTLDAPDMTRRVERAIIFNQEKEDKMLPEAACAFTRHAFNIFYHDFANVEKGHIFVWQKVYYRALTSLRRAANASSCKRERRGESCRGGVKTRSVGYEQTRGQCAL